MRILEVKTGGRPVQMAPIALGAQPMGSTMPEETAFACLDAFCQWGESRGAPVCVDTARVYSSWIPGGDGTSERTIGRWLSRSGNREKVVLSTKGGHPAEPGLPRLDRESLRRDLAESLAHLNTDHVELYFLHRDDPRRPVGEILESLNEWVESGAVRALGASNWRASRIEEANRYAASHGLQGFTVSQIQWSLARTSPDKLGDPTLVCMTPAEYAWYREQRFPVMAYTSQAGGYFSKALSGASLSPGDQARYGCEESSRRMERVKTICARRGVTPAAGSRPPRYVWPPSRKIRSQAAPSWAFPPWRGCGTPCRTPRWSSRRRRWPGCGTAPRTIARFHNRMIPAPKAGSPLKKPACAGRLPTN